MRTWLCAVSLVAALSVACSDDDTTSTNANGSSGQTGTTESGLSKGYQSICATCHGPEGRGQGIYPSIPGSRSEASFISIVRSGRDEMPATDASSISDADLKADYLWLTTKRP